MAIRAPDGANKLLPEACNDHSIGYPGNFSMIKPQKVLEVCRQPLRPRSPGRELWPLSPPSSSHRRGRESSQIVILLNFQIYYIECWLFWDLKGKQPPEIWEVSRADVCLVGQKLDWGRGGLGPLHPPHPPPSFSFFPSGFPCAQYLCPAPSHYRVWRTHTPIVYF